MDHQSLGGKEFLLFRYLLKNNKTDLKTMDENLPLSHVSIRSALNEIDSFLEKNGIKKLERSKGKIFLDLESLKELKVECSYFNSGRERFNYILAKFIFNEITSVNSLVEELNVTRKTLDSDLKKIKKFIASYGLKISTKLWNGTSIEGDFENRYRLAVDFVASVSIFKELNLDFYRIFQLEKNNIVYRELRNHISRRENEEAEKFMLELFQELNYAGNIYFYYIGVAMVLVGKIYGVEIRGTGLAPERKALIQNESQKKNVKKTIEIIENIMKNYPNLSFSREEIENFIYFMGLIDLRNNIISEETAKFI
ncbi:MAG: helix-turn-helix domain-containing protein, partial [Cetobacterium sp.]